jgi:hypothetical protein
VSLTFTVFFEDPFWVGLFESTDGGTAQYARVVFGKEPTDAELYDFFHKNFIKLQFSASLPLKKVKPPAKNPKRRQREISKELHNQTGIKKSYEAVKLSEHQNLIKQKKEITQNQKETKERYKFGLKQEKRKEKHRGR